ncbi:tetratricopeptide repeat protein [Calidithermus chliarophilus]|uniref:tetratricopeptide repeat protein n=1 Tax=Calidithermus chliarophilus TaxID=52023 RepID=UPI000426EC32|nr:tetratricopeptide repeat protein [Calidithermus chliarophilus]
MNDVNEASPPPGSTPGEGDVAQLEPAALTPGSPLLTAEQAAARLEEGLALYRQGSLGEAIRVLTQAQQGFFALGHLAPLAQCLLAQGRVYRDLGQLEKAVQQFAQASSLARQAGNHKAVVEALNLEASVLSIQGEHARALECLGEGLAAARRLGLAETQANILNNTGQVHLALGDYARALEHLKAAYELFSSLGLNSRGSISNLVNLGMLYQRLGDSARALELFEQALAASREAGDQLAQTAVLNNLANLYLGKGEWAKARTLFQRALSKARQLGLRQFEVDNLDGLGQVYTALGQHPQALRTHAQTLSIARTLGDREGEVDALLNLGRSHLAMGRFEQALGPLQEALSLAQSLGNRRSAYEAHECLCEAHRGLGRFEQALEHHQEFHRLEREVFNEESERRTRQLSVQFDLQRARNEAEMYRLRTELEQKAREEAEAKVRERTRELEEAHLEVVNRLALAAEYRDDATGEHTRRVGRLSALIARTLGWPDPDVALLQSAARLHDVGKIGIPDAILLKPGRLSPPEFALMRQHTHIGSQILSGGNSKLLQMAQEIALAHHERWDGTGYPLGLAGEQIPLSARIVAVADVLDALLNERPYKPAWPLERAVEELERQGGRQFDPAVVRACLEVIRQGMLEEGAPE